MELPMVKLNALDGTRRRRKRSSSSEKRSRPSRMRTRRNARAEKDAANDLKEDGHIGVW